MIRLSDAVVLAATKLRAHRIRTGLITGVSGILFGLLVAVVIIAQGVFDSVEKFSSVGLGDRHVLLVEQMNSNSHFNIYQNLDNPAVVERVEAAHNDLVTKKQAAAKKYNIEYDPKAEDPTPVIIDKDTGKKVIDDEKAGTEIVMDVESQMIKEQTGKSNIEKSLEGYSSDKQLGNYHPLTPNNGNLLYMKDGIEQELDDQQRQTYESFGYLDDESSRSLYVLPQTLADPFISSKGYDPVSGELPIILPYNDAEKLLGLNPLPKNATPQERRNRMVDVHRRIGEIKVDFCYRNKASTILLEQARSTAAEIEKNRGNKDYTRPSLIYSVPDKTSCGEVTITSDTRSQAEKQAEENLKSYQKEIGTYPGEPEQYKLVFRAVGVSADTNSINQQSTVTGMVQSMLSSYLGYNSWNIPEGLLDQVPENFKPSGLFNKDSVKSAEQLVRSALLVEFNEPNEARGFMSSANSMNSSFYAVQFGSASLIMADLKDMFERIILWVVLVVGFVAVIILSGLVGRTIADSRRETAVFRSIGATRADISSIYVMYTMMFSLRVVLFAFALGVILAGLIHYMWQESATIGAELAYGAVDTGLVFGFIGFMNIYLPIIAGVIIVVGLAASLLPILRNVRRSPINDMRDE